jgi:hypothetical protein
VCSSVHLVRRLGEEECRDCGAVGQAVIAANLAGEHDAPPGPVSLSEAAGDDAAASLADEVERALSRVLGPSPQRPVTMS